MRTTIRLGVFVICIAIFSYLAYQNYSLKSEIGNVSNDLVKLSKVVEAQKRLTIIEGDSVPLSDIVYKPSSSTSDKLLLMVFNPNVCGTCISEQLKILKRTLTNDLQVHVLVGTQSSRDKDFITSLKQDGLLVFPFSYIKFSKLEHHFTTSIGDYYIKTPTYYYVEEERVVNTYKSSIKTTNLFEEWLASIQEQ